MKLEHSYEKFLYLTNGRKVYIQDTQGSVEQIGTIPNPNSGLERLKTNVKTGGISASLRRLLTGRVHSVNVWPINNRTLISNATNLLFCTRDGGETWNHIKTLHPSSGIRGLLPNGLCYQNGRIYIGEYIFDESRAPRVFTSDDLGKSWHTEIVLNDVRHVHAVQADPYTGDIWVATGDRDTESKIGRLVDGSLDILGTGSQLWRAVEMVFTPEYLLWGTDCPYKDNHILRVHRSKFNESPRPDVVYTGEEPFYYSTSIDLYNRTDVLFSTGVGFKPDSTAPDSISQKSQTECEVEVVGGSSTSDFSHWNSLTALGVKRRLTNRLGFHDYAANAYIFLASSPLRGIFLNPINTDTKDGDVLSVSTKGLQQSRNIQSAFENNIQRVDMT